MGTKTIEICDCCKDEFIVENNSMLDEIKFDINVGRNRSISNELFYCMKCSDRFRIQIVEFLQKWNILDREEIKWLKQT